MISKSTKAKKFSSLDFLNDLSSPTARRRFFTVLLTLAAVSGTVFYFSNEIFSNIKLLQLVKSASIQILTANIMILVLFGAYLLYIGEDIERPEIETLRPGDINGEINSLPFNTSFYYLWGRSATFFRTETIRKIDEISKATRRTIEVHVLLPDPEIKEIAESYEKISIGLGDKVHPDKLFINAVATLAVASILSSKNRNLKVQVHFSKFLPSFRIDMSEGGAIITEDDKKLYGLKFSRSSQFFEMYRTMIIQEIEISRTPPLGLFKWTSCDLNTEAPIEGLLTFGFNAEKVTSLHAEINEALKSQDNRYS